MEAQDTSNPIALRLSVLGPNGKPVMESEFLKEKIVLGRILSADLRIDDPRVSRIHALIEVRGESLILTDLASSHGTFVNGKKVVESKLKLGDTVRVGFIEVKVEKGTGKPSVTKGNFEGKPVFEGDETLLDIDRSMLESSERRGPDRRKKDAFPEERRLEQRRGGDRRIEQRSQTDRRKPVVPGAPVELPAGVAEDRRKTERRGKEETDRRVGERRRADRRVFDITSLERRIEERRIRRGDDDLLPEELERAFATPDHAQELEITVLWGEHILDVSNYVDPVVLTVGEDAKNHYIIPSVGIPDEFPLVSIEEDGTAHLSFTEDMKGTIRCRDKIYTVRELTDEKFVRKNGSSYVVALRRDDFAKLSIGSINFFILYVKPAPRILPPPLFDRDVLLIRTFIGSMLLLILFFVSVNFLPKPIPVTIDMVPERFARIVIKRKPKIPNQALSGTKSVEGGSVMGEGGRAKGEEGMAGKKELPKDKPMAQVIHPKNGEVVKKEPGTPKTVSAKPKETPRKVVDANAAKSVGLLKAFSKSGIKSDLKSLTNGTGEGGGFDEFGKAVAGLRGKTLEEGGGAGGKGLKGVGVGGGGTTIGIDGPSTKGFGRGWSGDGIGEGISGPGRLGIKGEHAISIASENIQVLSGLPKDMINAVVQKHRSEIRACYDAALRRNPNLRGKIVIAFTIQPNGIVSAASVKESTLGDRGLGGCITDRVKSWGFPQPEAPVVTEVSAYPFYLVPAN